MIESLPEKVYVPADVYSPENYHDLGKSRTCIFIHGGFFSQPR